MSRLSRASERLVARDPARARLIVAVAVASGVLLSAGAALVITDLLHAEQGLVAMAIFLSVQAGNTVKDSDPRSRLATAALLVPTVVLGVVVAALLSPSRPVLIVVFVLLAGSAVWVRRFGPRAAAIGGLVFMGYFFTLFMKPTSAQLLAFALVAGAAATSQVLVRALLLLRRPRRELDVLLRQFRAASVTALAASGRARHEARVRTALQRIDDIARAITGWQGTFATSDYVGWDADTLDVRVLDARVAVEELCVLRAPARGDGLRVVLDDRSTSRVVNDAVVAAQQVLADATGRTEVRIVDYLTARATLAQGRLRQIPEPPERIARPRAPQTIRATRALAAPEHQHPAKEFRWRWVPWRDWQPTSRMALQALVAAALASVVGELISATRWYWAVMTAFVIFLGASSRGGILTRAFRRIAGTTVGVVVGAVIVALIGGDDTVLVIACVLAVFGMLYFGPIDYAYSAGFMTVTVVALYRMLGVLDGQVLELRVVETLSGAVIGVACAYLIASADSRPALRKTIGTYFDALDALLHASGRSQARDVTQALHSVEAAGAQVDQAVSGMATAFLITAPRREADMVHLMHHVTRAAAALAQATVDTPPRSSAPFHAALGDARRAATAARRALCGAAQVTPDGPRDTRAVGAETLVDPSGVAAEFALSELSRSLDRIVVRADS